MRNLKRALSLALSSVMLLSMMVVGSGASYADVDSADNVEAIEVMQAVSVMSGDDNGNFNPDEEVTRGEMAVVMANLLDLQVEDFVGASIPFTDVPDWAVSYVAACYADGITAGISDTEYGFSNEVTATQAALMMLKALGYFQYSSDFGSNWQVATIRQASSIQLFDGIDTGADSALTRNEVAQISLNTLESTMVQPDGTPGNITTSDGTIINLGDVTYEERTSTNSKYAAIDDEEGDNGRYTMELGEDLFDGDLEKSADTDRFGRPGYTWEYEGDKIGTYADSADEVFVVDDSDITDVEEVLTGSDYLDYSDSEIRDANVSINGADDSEVDDTVTVGDIVEVYEDEDGNVSDVVVRRYEVAVIDEIDTDLSTSEEQDGASVELTLVELEGDTNIGSYYDNYDDEDEVLTGYTSAYEEGTVLAIARTSDSIILDSYVADEMTGSVSSYRDDSVSLDGTRYYYNGNVQNVPSDYDFDSDYVLYLDANGLVIGVDGASAANLDDVYYVTGVYGEESRYGSDNWTVYAQAVSLADGTVQEIELDWDNDVDADNSDNDLAEAIKDSIEDASDPGKWIALNKVAEITDTDYLYTFDSDGLPTEWPEGNSDYIVTPATLEDDVKVDDTRIDTDEGNFYVDENTRYVAVESDADDIDVTVSTGGMKLSDGVDVIMIADEDSKKDAVYVVYLGSGASVATEDVLFVASDDFDSVSDGNVSGEVYFMETAQAEEITIDEEPDFGSFYMIDDIDEDGVYTLTKQDSGDESYISVDGENYVDDDSEGWYQVDGLEGDDVIFRNYFTYMDDSDVLFDDVDISDARVVDARLNNLSTYAYDRAINSTSRLDDALETGTVDISLYVIDGVITFVAVTDSEGADGGNGGDGYTAESILEDYIDGLETSFEYENAVVTSTAVRTAVEEEYTESGYDYDGDEGAETVDISVTSVSFADGSYEAPGTGGEKVVDVNVTLSVEFDEETATDTITVSVTVIQNDSIT